MKDVVSGEEARSRSEWRKAQGTQRTGSRKESEESDWFDLEWNVVGQTGEMRTIMSLENREEQGEPEH